MHSRDKRNDIRFGADVERTLVCCALRTSAIRVDLEQVVDSYGNTRLANIFGFKF